MYYRWFVSGLCLFRYTNPQNLIYWQLQTRSEIVNFWFQPICVLRETQRSDSDLNLRVLASWKDSLYLFVYRIKLPVTRALLTQVASGQEE